jgi:hypothetical protein
MPEVQDSSSSCHPGTAAVTGSPDGLDFLFDKSAVLTNAKKARTRYCHMLLQAK